MASTLRLPAGTSACIVPSASFVPRLSVAGSYQCRAFSQTSQQWAGARQMNFRPPSQAQPAFKTKTKGMKIADLPNDIGMLPGTFVRPLWRDMPSIFQAPRDRFHMEWTWFKTWLSNYASLLQYCKRENSLPLLLGKRRPLAADFLKAMYTAFAEGNIPKIRAICCDGLSSKFIQAIERRPAGEKVSWKLVKLLRQPSTNFTGLRVISDRATSIPDIPNSGIRQVIVRVTSRQATTTTRVLDDRGKPLAEPIVVDDKEQDCIEHLVIQHLRWNNKDKGWRVWGTTTPTTLDIARNDPYFKPGLSTLERLDLIKNSMGK